MVPPSERAPEVRVPAVLEALREAARFVRRLTRQADLDIGSAYRLRLAVDELVTNIVVHGYREGDGGEIGLSGGVESDRVWVRIEDTAPAFDPVAGRVAPDTGVPAQCRRIGGLGIHLAMTSVDDLTYDRREGRNISTLTVVIDKKSV